MGANYSVQVEKVIKSNVMSSIQDIEDTVINNNTNNVGATGTMTIDMGDLSGSCSVVATQQISAKQTAFVSQLAASATEITNKFVNFAKTDAESKLTQENSGIPIGINVNAMISDIETNNSQALNTTVKNALTNNNTIISTGDASLTFTAGSCSDDASVTLTQLLTVEAVSSSVASALTKFFTDNTFDNKDITKLKKTADQANAGFGMAMFAIVALVIVMVVMARYRKSIGKFMKFLPWLVIVIGIVVIVLGIMNESEVWSIVNIVLGALMIVVSIGFLIYQFISNRRRKKREEKMAKVQSDAGVTEEVLDSMAATEETETKLAIK